jgi:hypothetical protein
MSGKYQDIQAGAMQLNADGSVELSDDLLDLIAGGVSPEEQAEDEASVSNTGCTVNVGCKPK